MSQNWTIKRLLDWTAEFFKEQGADQPRLDAEVLLAEALECQRIELYTRFDEEVIDPGLSKFREWVRRHAQGEPVAYLVGHREFFSLDFVVTPEVLIPRPETEHLVLLVLDLIKQHFPDQDPVKIVDVGTGSGCLAIAIAQQCPRARLLGVDVSAGALEIAQQNVTAHDLQQRVLLAEGSLLDPVQHPQAVQIVVSNPPYIGQAERDQLPVSVRDYEPATALFSTDDRGMATTQELINQFVQRCSPGSWLAVETSPMLAQDLAACFRQAGLAGVQVGRDYANLDRVISGQIPAAHSDIHQSTANPANSPTEPEATT